MIASAPERRAISRGAILIKDSNSARAAWIHSSLLPFFGGSIDFFTSYQRRLGFRRQSDILVLGDPSAFKDASIHHRNAVMALRYTLTKQTWQTVLCMPHGAAITLLSGGSGIAGAFRNALDQLQRPDIRLTSLDDGVAGTGAWNACCRVRIQTTHQTPRAMTLEREVEPPVIAPGVIFNLARRLGRLNGEAHQAILKYLCSAAPVLADSEILLNSVVETKGCLDDAASACGQVVIQLDDHDAVIDISGPVEVYSERHLGAGILGSAIGDIFPQLATAVARPAGIVEQHVSINGHASILRVVPLARKPKRTLVVLAPSRTIQGARGAVLDRRTNGASYHLADIIGNSLAMEKTRQLALRAGRSDSPILIVGESGTGKELFAHAMHNVSRRASAPFIPINCAAIPESLIEAELFGHEHGAFTGARRHGRASLFERADGGTLFLDELGDMSSHVQAALLRVLEEGVVTRVGGSRPVSVDVRVIGAANRPLEDLIMEGAFRRDLYHRLCVFPLWIPPLRERRQDIPVLARDFLKALGDARALPDEVMDYLLRYRWPGNVRELQHCLRYMAAVTDDSFTIADLPPHIQPYVQINDVEEGPDGIAPRAANPANNPMVHAEDICSSLQDEGCCAILALIESANHIGAVIGRRTLREKVRQAGLGLTERAVRTRLCALRADGLVEWGLGRSGVRLTATGRCARRQAGSL